MKGYIVKGIGGFYYVKTEEGVIECKPRGIFRKQKITPVAGDEVTLETENGAAVIAEIAPRKNVFVRPPVANLDVLFLVASTTQPTPSTLVLDKLSAIAVDKGVQPVIVCTKADLGEVEFLRSAYERSTLPFIAIRYDSGEGLDEVRQWISGRLCAFCGNSGVGKSTLLNTLLPQAERETSAISQKLGRGRHTTREVTIFEAFGGRIADTPGFASLEANRAGFIPKENLEHAFPEFGPYLGQCQFTGCSHRTEKGWPERHGWHSPFPCSVSSRAAPTARKRAVPSVPLWPRENSPRPGTTATVPCMRKSRMSRTGRGGECDALRDPLGLPGLAGAEASAPPR